jgi:hypothetical protein
MIDSSRIEILDDSDDETISPAISTPSASPSSRGPPIQRKSSAARARQSLIAYRSKGQRWQKPKPRSSASESHDDDLDYSAVDRLSPSTLAVPNIGQLNLLPIKCTPAVQRSVQYCTYILRVTTASNYFRHRNLCPLCDTTPTRRWPWD